jgi:glycosyltransferase involved in cell wall biosynthesis
MRLAYLSTDPEVPYGDAKGASVHLAAITDALAEEDNDILVLVAGVGPGSFPTLGVELEPLPSEGVEGLVRRLKEFGAEALYERLALSSDAGTAAARRLGIPHLVELNAPLPEEAARQRSLDEPEQANRLEREVLRAADVVFAVSPPLAEYARRRGARRVEILQNAAAADRFPPREWRDGEPVAAFAGQLRPWQGVEVIGEAWTILGSAAPALLVIGDGPGSDRLRPLGAVVTGRLPAERVPALLSGADIGLAPYSADAPDYFSPLKLFDYLAAGLATVVGDLPAVRDVVGPDSAMVIPRGDAQALADAVAALAADPARRRSLGENGRALVAAGHTWRHRARRIVDVAAELSGVRDAQVQT